ncbi:hypothetical protein ACJJIW_17655 [Microbulbifer sp. JMSA004]|uniref:hypothetical protein n=1 Tax=Microbulbifer sp. JMSA004 TaxID=3243370 RepID=UPI0040392E7E
MKLTPEERAVVAQCIAEDPRLKRTLIAYWPYIFPLCAAAIYGIVKKDYLLIGIAFFFLVCEVLWFLNETSKSAKHLKAALIKYDLSNRTKSVG